MTPFELGLGYCLIVPVVAAFAVVSTPNTADIPAVMGAVFASTIVVLDAMSTQKTRLQWLSAFIASALVGSTAPGAVMYIWWPERAANLTWHAWAGMGFVAGLAGWAIAHALLKLFSNRIPGALNKQADRFLGEQQKSNEDDEV